MAKEFAEITLEELLDHLKNNGEYYGKIHLYEEDGEMHIGLDMYDFDFMDDDEWDHACDTASSDPVFEIDEVVPSHLINMAKMFAR